MFSFKGPNLMRKFFVGLLVLNVPLFVPAAPARDTEYQLSIQEVMRDPEYKQKLGNEVAFFFGTQETPAIERSFGDSITNRKSNSFGKSDQSACRWAMLSALMSLRERALRMGGKAVVNIHNYHKVNLALTDVDYECHAGPIIAGVALKGTVVILKN